MPPRAPARTGAPPARPYGLDQDRSGYGPPSQLTARTTPTTLSNCFINRFSETTNPVFGLLLTLLILDGILLVVVVLLQAGKGGGLAAMGGGGGAGTDSFMGGRQAATVLTKATWATGAVFLGLAVVLSILSSQRQGDSAPLLQEEFRETAPTAPQPILPGAGEGAAGEGEGIPGLDPGGGGAGEGDAPPSDQ